jgi:hypothetical protein
LCKLASKEKNKNNKQNKTTTSFTRQKIFHQNNEFKAQIEGNFQAREQNENQALMKIVFIEMKASCNTIVAQYYFKP